MKVLETKIPGVILLEPKVFGDYRGFFVESYNKQTFDNLNLKYNFIQDNHSLSAQPGTLRGLHYQLGPKAQTKLVRVTQGSIYDVVVDMRKNSPTYGKWEGFILSSENKRQLLVPKGFAHGFCTIASNTEVQYKVDEYYSPDHDRGVIWNDPHLKINWPTFNPILSEKDTKHPVFLEADNNFEWER
jgi:dTDP-4-dehydrorhamnose 3,5-epimerase